MSVSDGERVAIPQPRRLQLAVAVASLVPIAAGLAGVLLGPRMAAGPVEILPLDSHFRYLSGLLLGIGLVFWSIVPRIATHGRTFRVLTVLVVFGGLGRLAGMILAGTPSLPMVLALGMELVVTPLLCLWQWRTRATG